MIWPSRGYGAPRDVLAASCHRRRVSFQWIALIVSGRSFDSPPEGLLLSGAVGDVLAARRAARALLAGSAAEADGGLATLFLTASLLHCAIHGGGEARRVDVADYLGGVLDSGTPGPGMLRSPLQFLRYAGAEVEALLPQPRCRLTAHLLSLVSDSGYVEDCGADESSGTAHWEP